MIYYKQCFWELNFFFEGLKICISKNFKPKGSGGPMLFISSSSGNGMWLLSSKWWESLSSRVASKREKWDLGSFWFLCLSWRQPSRDPGSRQSNLQFGIGLPGHPLVAISSWNIIVEYQQWEHWCSGEYLQKIIWHLEVPMSGLRKIWESSWKGWNSLLR